MTEQVPYPQVVPTQQVVPAQWEMMAIVPIMVLMMVFSIIMKVVTRATEPEFIREIRPVAETALIARRGPKLRK